MAQDDIQGQVVDGAGNPVSGAIVELTKSYQSSPLDEQVVRRTTTDTNGNYIFEFHPDGDGTTQEWHVSCYNHDGTAYVNSFNNPGVTADLPESLIPDSAVAQYNAKKITGISDGGSVSSRTDRVGSLDLSGSATYRSGGINGFASVDYDGSNDGHDASGSTLNQKFVIYAVIDPDFSVSVSDRNTIATGNVPTIQWDGTSGKWLLFAGSELFGSTTADRRIITAVFDGANSQIREDGTQTASGDGGTSSLDLLSIGARLSKNDRYFDGDIAFVEVHDGDVSSGLQTREQQIADKFNISV